MNNNSTESQRRVLGLMNSLMEDNRTKAIRDWAALAPADEAEAKDLLNAALVLLVAISADERLGGSKEYVAKMMQRHIHMEGSGQ